MTFAEEDTEDEETWIALDVEDNGPNEKFRNEETPAPDVAHFVRSEGNEQNRGSGNAKANAKPNSLPKQPVPQERQTRRRSHAGDNGGGSTSSARLRNVQRKLEDRISIQTHLVNHPIDYFWQRCLINSLRQVWQLEFRIRLGILLLAAGLLTRVFLWSTWYLMYPRFAILSFLLVASILYLDPFDLQDQIKDARDFLAALTAPSSSISQQQQQLMVNGIDTDQIRRLSLVLFLLPTFLEVRTLSFLSSINAELTVMNAANASADGWTFSWASSYLFDIGVTLCIFTVMMFLLKVRRMKCCDVSHRGLLILYGFTLLITISSYDNGKNDLRRIPVLAAPFFTASATLLLMYQDDRMEWLSRIVRQTFRLSLRDVLSSVSERVTEDEMLQLAILRWICDFWASTQASASKPDTIDDSNSSSSIPTSTALLPLQSSSELTRVSCTSATPPSVESNTARPFEPNVIQWEELQPMLNIEIDHMETEIVALQPGNNHSCGNSDKPSDDGHHESERRGSDLGLVQLDQMDGRLSPNPNALQHHKQQTSESMDSLMALKSMLVSFDVDDRAQPAVLAYKRAVESFPPKKKTAVTVSVIRRCPALLTLILHIFSANDFNLFFISTLILSPFIAIEYYRIIGWMDACERYSPIIDTERDENEAENDWRIPVFLRNLDTMTILFSDDVHNAFRPPSLLLVWHNIVGSVSALEMGLSTARCAETTAVAIEFAGSAMSLVKFGFEVSQNGIFHGAVVLLKEALSIHASGRDIRNPGFSDDGEAEYTSAAIRAVHSGQKVVRNIHALSEDQNVMHAAQPVLHFFGALVGHKWLWGKDEEENENADAKSKVILGDPGIKDDNIRSDNEAELRDHKTKASETNEGNDKKATDKFTNDEESMSGASNNSISVSELLSPEEELTEVMEMVALAYEYELIEEREKDEFFQKLVDFREDELYDRSILSAMKRTLQIVLENGEKDPTRDSVAPSSDFVESHLQIHGTGETENRNDEIVNEPKESEPENSEFPFTNESDASQKKETDQNATQDSIAPLGGVDRSIVDNHDSETFENESDGTVNEPRVIKTKYSGVPLHNKFDASQTEDTDQNPTHDSVFPSSAVDRPVLNDHDTGEMVNDRRAAGMKHSEWPLSNESDASQTMETDPFNSGEDKSKEEKTGEDNDNLLALGIAALGVVAGGVVVAMGMNAQKTNETRESFDAAKNVKKSNDDRETNGSSTVEIVELTDHESEENWTAIDQ